MLRPSVIFFIYAANKQKQVEVNRIQCVQFSPVNVQSSIFLSSFWLPYKQYLVKFHRIQCVQCSSVCSVFHFFQLFALFLFFFYQFSVFSIQFLKLLVLHIEEQSASATQRKYAVLIVDVMEMLQDHGWIRYTWDVKMSYSGIQKYMCHCPLFAFVNHSRLIFHNFFACSVLT